MVKSYIAKAKKRLQEWSGLLNKQIRFDLVGFLKSMQHRRDLRPMEQLTVFDRVQDIFDLGPMRKVEISCTDGRPRTATQVISCIRADGRDIPPSELGDLSSRT